MQRACLSCVWLDSCAAQLQVASAGRFSWQVEQAELFPLQARLAGCLPWCRAAPPWRGRFTSLCLPCCTCTHCCIPQHPGTLAWWQAEGALRPAATGALACHWQPAVPPLTLSLRMGASGRSSARASGAVSVACRPTCSVGKKEGLCGVSCASLGAPACRCVRCSTSQQQLRNLTWQTGVVVASCWREFASSLCHA